MKVRGVRSNLSTRMSWHFDGRKQPEKGRIYQKRGSKTKRYCFPSLICAFLKQSDTLLQAETINRLLKKQSRPRNKRVNTTDSHLPQSGARTPKPKIKTGEEGEEAEGEEEEEQMEPIDTPEEIKPTMFRWVSSLHEKTGGTEEKQIQMIIRFSVPGTLSESADNKSRATQIEAGSPLSHDTESEGIRRARGPGICAIEGCGKPRKYRVPKDWTVGACGSEHLRLVASRV